MSQTLSRKRDRESPSPPQQSTASSPPAPALYPQAIRPRSQPYLFPRAQSTVLPDSTKFFAPQLSEKPHPTNSFFQNYVLKKGDKPEYIHPYLIKSYDSKLTICYPDITDDTVDLCQVFVNDLVISTKDKTCHKSRHVVSSFSDLSVTLDFPVCNLKFFLVRGSPFLTCSVARIMKLSISSDHTVLELCPNKSRTKYVIKLNNNQAWLLYSSSPIYLSPDGLSSINCDDFVGVIRIAALPSGDKKYEQVLDKYSSCYPVSGHARFTRPYCLEYRWLKLGRGELLMLAHPLHVKLLSNRDGSVTVLDDFKYDSINGGLIGVVGDSWVLKSDPISVTWHSINGVDETAWPKIIEALVKDVETLDSGSVTESSLYLHGKLIARAARLALIAEEVRHVDVIPTITKFLKEMIEPWLYGTCRQDGFLYDPEWGGIVTKGSEDSKAEFGFGIYDNHHYHLGYFVYGISVLTKIDPTWGQKFKSKSYALMADYMNLSTRGDADYTRLRCFDLWKLHSWASGLTESEYGRTEDNSGESVNAYYAAALMGLAYGDTQLASVATTLTAFEIKAAQTWRHVKAEEKDTVYPSKFTTWNRVVETLWACKRSWFGFGMPLWSEAENLGMQVLPISPISQVLFSDVRFVRGIVGMIWSGLAEEGVVKECWRGFVYALQGIFDREGALGNVKTLTCYDDGNSLTNLLWWIHSRGCCDDDDDDGHRGKICSWFRHYCD